MLSSIANGHPNICGTTRLLAAFLQLYTPGLDAVLERGGTRSVSACSAPIYPVKIKGSSRSVAWYNKLLPFTGHLLNRPLDGLPEELAGRDLSLLNSLLRW